MTKAILANTATDLAGGLGQDGRGGAVRAAPNTEQGWGRVNVGTLLDDTPRVFHDQDDNLLDGTGDSVLRMYDVGSSSDPVKVTLAWTDAPGMVGANAYVNNLDLVVDAGGRTYKGNVFAGGRSVAGATPIRATTSRASTCPRASTARRRQGDRDQHRRQRDAGTPATLRTRTSPLSCRTRPRLRATRRCCGTKRPGCAPMRPASSQESSSSSTRWSSMPATRPATGVSGILSGDDLTLSQDSSDWLKSPRTGPSRTSRRSAERSTTTCPAVPDWTRVLTLERGWPFARCVSSRCLPELRRRRP